MEETVKKLTEELLEKIGAKAEVTAQKEEDIYKLLIESEDNALLIGKHGNTLSSLELIISLMLAKKTGEYKKVIIEIGGYRKEREEYLNQLVSRMKESVNETGIEKNIRGLKPWERRFIHLLLKDDENVTTESVGEGNERTLIIKKK